jgi:hypothetical protein
MFVRPSVCPSVTSCFRRRENALSVTHCSEYGVIFCLHFTQQSLSKNYIHIINISDHLMLVLIYEREKSAKLVRQIPINSGLALTRPVSKFGFIWFKSMDKIY